MKNNITPKITLVGAGPGDIDLITIKGQKAIKSASVILYDALVNEELLDLAPNSVKIFVGKRKGFKAYSQDEINRLLVDYALQYGNVVRLKGGDSYVFGRGYEELLFTEAFDIKVEVVPGISSSIGVPALAGIPVTHRNVSNGFYVLTGTLSNGELNPEILATTKINATILILMGLSKIQEIVEIYQKEGLGETPVAIVSNGSLPNQQSVFGTIDTIIDLAVNEKIQAPGVIVIGEVIGLKNQFNQVLSEVVAY